MMLTDLEFSRKLHFIFFKSIFIHLDHQTKLSSVFSNIYTLNNYYSVEKIQPYPPFCAMVVA